jgi:hypothetical protein
LLPTVHVREVAERLTLGGHQWANASSSFKSVPYFGDDLKAALLSDARILRVDVGVHITRICVDTLIVKVHTTKYLH